MTNHGGESILKIADLSISFGGVKAVNGLNLQISEGEIFAIIGPNGAGKTTVFNIMSGFYRPDSGSVVFRGIDLVQRKPHQIAKLGIGRTFQNLELFSRMTVLENLLIANHLYVKTNFWSELMMTRRVRQEEERAKSEAMAILDYLKLGSYADKPIADFPFPIQKRIELARALTLKPKLLLLDEPAGGLNAVETKELSSVVRSIRDDFKVTVLLVEHDMSMVMSISNRICVLDYGISIAQGPPQEIQTNPRVIEAYLGKGKLRA
jgi:branched-chain amino acid transport system ATP-binding protein